ncbi:MAG: hypothetical protein Kilf2KO_17640 [Rhodospirillales bacterium]
MARWVAATLAIVLATAASLAWLGGAAYLLRDRTGFIDPTRVTLPEAIGALCLLVLLPVVVWTLALVLWRGPEVSKRLARIETAVADGGGLDADIDAQFQVLRANAEATLQQLQETADVAKAERRALVELAAPMGDLASRLHEALTALDAVEAGDAEREVRLARLIELLEAVKTSAQPLQQIESPLAKAQADLEAAIEALTVSGEAAAARLQGQVRALEADGAKLAAPRREASADSARLDFLASATTLFNDLNDKVADLNALMKVEVPEALFAAMKAGDRTALARRLPRLKDSSGARGIRLHYQHDAAFKALADRYMEGFETLLEQARAADPDSGLAGLFLTSDLGRLYLVLSRDSGRDSAASAG